MSIGDAITKQLDATWRELEIACEQIPAEHWKPGEPAYLAPARHVLHSATTAAWYFQDVQAAEPIVELKQQHLEANLDFESAAEDELPDQTTMLAFVAACKQHCAQWVAGKSDGDWLAPQQQYPWTGPSLLSRTIYVIRHTQAHIGEINSELRRRGLDRIQWQA